MRQFPVLLCAAMLLTARPAWAQQAGPEAEPIDQRIGVMIDRARQIYGVRDPRDRCRRREGQEIVVCVDRGEDLRVPSTAESDPNSREARRYLDNGVPRAPQLDRGSCKGQPGCVVGGWAPPPIYEVDVSQLPQAPEGSEADLVAKGELAPR